MNVYQRKQTSFEMTLAIKPHFLKKKKKKKKKKKNILHSFNAAGLCVDGHRYTHARE